MRCFSYIVARDYGFAPNPFHGFCTLANCIKVVGIIKPEENSIMSSSSSSAIGYTHELTEYLVNKVNDSEVVKEQKNSPDTDIFTG